MALGYSYALSEVASEFVFRLPGFEQLHVAAVFRQLAASPFRTGDYTTRDDTGRVLQNLLVEDWVITFWTDHAVKEVRITEVVQV